MPENANISNISPDHSKAGFAIPTQEELAERKYPLKGQTIGISVSESDHLQELGYSVSHIKDAIIEVTRYIIALGGSVAYGGDMRQGGFTELIFDLLAYYKSDKQLAPHERFYSYLAYPLSATLSIDKEASLKQTVSFKKIAPPDDLAIADTNVFLKPDTTENLYVWARSLTKMRQEMEATCHARIFVGGREKGFKGKYPGILEELIIALENKHPVYLIGAFGGVTSSAINALQNIQSGCFLPDAYQNNQEYLDLINFFNARHPAATIDYSNYFAFLNKTGLKGIADLNGLTVEENVRLSVTPHIHEIIFLIIKGLSTISRN